MTLPVTPPASVPVPVPAPWTGAARRPAPPQAWQPRPYPQLLRGPRHRWWRPLVGLAVVVGGLVALVIAAGIAFVVVAASTGDLSSTGQALSGAALSSWWGFLINNLLLAALIPLSVLAVFAGHRWRPRWVASVAGGIRWRWLGASAVVPLVALVLSIGGTWLLAGGQDAFGSGDRGSAASVAALLVVVVLTTPLQAAGEEYFFRGWLSQAVGSLFARAGVGAVVAAAVSSLLFGLAHGSQSPWLFADRVGFGLLASYLAWRTGGLESGIAFHALNNMIIFVPTVLAGGLGDALTTTEAAAGPVLVDFVVFLLVAAGVSALARRRRVQRLFAPPSSALPTGLG